MSLKKVLVLLEMGTETNKRGPGCWKLYVSYLKDSEYITKITVEKKQLGHKFDEGLNI